MKILLVVLCLMPSIAFGAFTEYYYVSGGNNVNSGSTSSTSATYTSTNGNWSTVTNIFTPTDGSTPASSVSVGDIASIYNDGATTAVYLARVTAVAAGVNGGITVSSSVATGSAPSTSATGRSIKVGGAWSTPFNATGFPLLSNSIQTVRNTNGDRVRLNLKNNQTYSTTGGASWTGMGNITIQGYTTTPGDGGKAIWSSSSTSATAWTLNSAQPIFIDVVFTSSAASNVNGLIALLNGASFIRCVFHDSRGNCLDLTSAGASVIDSEFYACNTSNTVGTYGIKVAQGVIATNTYFHDITTSNTVALGVTGVGCMISHCIFDTVNYGVAIGSTSVTGPVNVIENCEFYNITNDAINYNTTATYVITRNNNFLKNGRAINMASSPAGGISQNNAYGAGTYANTNADVLKSVDETGKITYPSNVSPWVAESTGNFTLTGASTKLWLGAGVQTFTETDGTNSGTQGFPDIGAAQHNDTCGGLGPCQTSGASAY